MIKVVSSIRGARSELNLPPSAKIDAWIDGGDDRYHLMVQRNHGHLNKLARIYGLTNAGPKSTNAFQVVVDEATYYLQLEGVIDIVAEKTRLTKALEASTKEAKSLNGRLSNPAFVEKAKPEAVEKALADHALHAAEAERLAAALARLG